MGATVNHLPKSCSVVVMVIVVSDYFLLPKTECSKVLDRRAQFRVQPSSEFRARRPRKIGQKTSALVKRCPLRWPVRAPMAVDVVDIRTNPNGVKSFGRDELSSRWPLQLSTCLAFGVRAPRSKQTRAPPSCAFVPLAISSNGNKVCRLFPSPLGPANLLVAMGKMFSSRCVGGRRPANFRTDVTALTARMRSDI